MPSSARVFHFCFTQVFTPLLCVQTSFSTGATVAHVVATTFKGVDGMVEELVRNTILYVIICACRLCCWRSLSRSRALVPLGHRAGAPAQRRAEVFRRHQAWLRVVYEA
jgi:hypothetical protein